MALRQFEGQRSTAGIGFAIARRLVGEGASVVISGRGLDRARRVAVGVDPSVEARAVDVMREESIVSFFNGIGAIDHLVVAAAKVGGGRFREESFDQARKSFECDVKSTPN
jgi:NADP-dependent 3-hydroxy acid dehydrogenase YdfG